MIKALTMNIQEYSQPMLPLSPQKGPDQSLEPNKKRSMQGNDLCPQVWDKPLMAVTCLFKKFIWYGKTFPYVQMRELRQNRRNERLQKILIPRREFVLKDGSLIYLFLFTNCLIATAYRDLLLDSSNSLEENRAQVEGRPELLIRRGLKSLNSYRVLELNAALTQPLQERSLQT